MLPTYLTYRMTGVLADAKANMIGHIPFDYKHRVWKKDSSLTKCLFDVEQEKLCWLVDSGEVLGKIAEAFIECSNKEDESLLFRFNLYRGKDPRKG